MGMTRRAALEKPQPQQGRKRKGRAPSGKYATRAVRRVVTAKGGLLLTAAARVALDRVRIQCGDPGHPVLETTAYAVVALGAWCVRCQSRERWVGRDIALADRVAARHGGRCLDRSFPSGQEAMRWVCRDGHRFAMPFYRASRGEWCTRCNRTLKCRAALERCRAWARERGGDCQSETYVRAHLPLRWRCADGHEWEAAPASMQANQTWCPYCVSSLGERVCRTVFEQLYGTTFPRAFPPWLVNRRTGRRLQLDGYNERLKLAFEYQGEQHVRVVGHMTPSVAVLRERRARDRLKRRQAAQRGVTVVSVPGFGRERQDPQAVRAFVLRALASAGVRLPARAHSRRVSLRAAFLATPLTALREIVADRNGVLLADRYLGWEGKHPVRCPCGYEWAPAARELFNGCWCPRCAGKLSPTIEDLRAVAAARGGRVLSRSCRSTRTHVHWECALGHRWRAVPYTVLRGTWCARCSSREKWATRRPIGLEKLKALGGQHGHTCLAKAYESAETPVRWRCAHQHEWERSLTRMRARPTCPECVCARRRGTRALERPLRARAKVQPNKRNRR